ncbi:glycosyltransferase [Mucilaginibacter boryungensis]|uniref:Glycosyltransferase family 1 protein n=1 Tax=Mucilaginibacter boryungensis TaxID=768480 RepID=A0ABR9XG06_9SPHI|nr:glycosyltransferase family 1 protein [Mucilaginibacter boryungensis]MBE9665995.1 glycosyltransferase family 1 protein [Mucilaginibacter boryungensis]
MAPLNIFYQEPDPDRWLPLDRYPRKLIRRLVRGKAKPGGVMMVALNLMQGLDKLNIPYRFNDFKYIKQHPEETACIIGKPQVLFEREWKNPIVFGAGIFSHPVECPDLLTRYPNIKRVLVPGNWMQKMFEPYYGNKVTAWPTGIDTEKWAPVTRSEEKPVDFLIYDKIRWERDKYVSQLLNPILDTLNNQSLKYTILQYGAYTPTDLQQALAQSKAAIFLCKHETQGLAYQQILSSGLPILAWDIGGYWQDPYYYPEIKYGPVSSVPYWDDRCGLKFASVNEFEGRLHEFMSLKNKGLFSPRKYILENLTIEKCAADYINIVQATKAY